LPLLRQFASDYGFTLKEYPAPLADLQNPSAPWLAFSKDRPNWVLMWGWGALTSGVLKEAVRVKFPMDHVIGIWWAGGEDDARAAGADAKGYLSLGISEVGAQYPALQDIKKLVVEQGKSQVASSCSGWMCRSRQPGAAFGESFYNRGIYNAVLVAEAI